LPLESVISKMEPRELRINGTSGIMFPLFE